MTHDQASNSTDNSTHDPLCAWWSIQCDSDCAELPYGSSCKHMFCVCDLTSKVRADERARQDRNAFTEIRFDGLRMAMGNFDPCPNCAERPCECKPAPCCGVPWNPQDFASGKDCWWCQRPAASAVRSLPNAK